MIYDERFQNNVRGYLRYTFRANIYSQFTKGVASLRFFVKANAKIYKTPLAFSSSTPMIMNHGSTTLKASIKGTSYMIKGEIPFTVEIDNSQGKSNVKNVLVKLVRKVQLKKVQDIKDRFVIENVISARTYQVNLPPCSKSQVLNYIFQIDDTEFSILTLLIEDYISNYSIILDKETIYYLGLYSKYFSSVFYQDVLYKMINSNLFFKKWNLNYKETQDNNIINNKHMDKDDFIKNDIEGLQTDMSA